MSRYPIYWLMMFLCFGACRKSGFITAGPESIKCSADTIRFDTVFTTAGSATTGFLIYNQENQAVNIQSVSLARGASSMFQINVDGSPGPIVKDIRIEPKDSIYAFVTVRIDPDVSTNPFLVNDSVILQLDGKKQYVILEAWGQNARFLRNTVINTNTRFDNKLPYVILGGLQVSKDIRLTIEAGSKIYLHADAPMIVDGSLEVNGTAASPVLFTGDRLDDGYKDLPASWPGIYLTPNSMNNLLTHARILNGFNGIVAEGTSSNGRPKLTLDRCVIDQAYEAGIVGAGSSIIAENCQVTNCGRNVLLLQGGQYQFTHCTVASFSNAMIPHKYPVFSVQNWDSTRQGVNTYPLSVQIDNSILWGDEGTVEHEIFASKRGTTPFQVNIRHALFRGPSDPPFVTMLNSIRNQPPQFDSINATKRYFDYRLQKKTSPALNKGIPGLNMTDLDDKPRDGQPDLGAFEKQ